MPSEAQRQALDLLTELFALSPNVRIGQLIGHLGFMGEAHVGKSLGGIDDDELVAVMRRHRRELLARSQKADPPTSE